MISNQYLKKGLLMKIRKGPVALVVLSLAAELAYIIVKGSREVAPAKDKEKRNKKK